MNLTYLIIVIVTYYIYFMASNQDIIALAISKSENDMLTVDEFITVTSFPINKIYYSIFWKTLEDKKWIYLSNEIIDLIGFEKGKSQGYHCYRLLKNSFIMDKHYKEVTKNHVDFAPPKRGAKVKVIIVIDCLEIAL